MLNLILNFTQFCYSTQQFLIISFYASHIKRCYDDCNLVLCFISDTHQHGILLPHSPRKIHPEDCVRRATNIGATGESSNIDVSCENNPIYIYCFSLLLPLAAHERQVLEFHLLQIHLRVWHRKCSISSRNCSLGFVVLRPRLPSSYAAIVQRSFWICKWSIVKFLLFFFWGKLKTRFISWVFAIFIRHMSWRRVDKFDGIVQGWPSIAIAKNSEHDR